MQVTLDSFPYIISWLSALQNKTCALNTTDEHDFSMSQQEENMSPEHNHSLRVKALLAVYYILIPGALYLNVAWLNIVLSCVDHIADIKFILTSTLLDLQQNIYFVCLSNLCAHNHVITAIVIVKLTSVISTISKLRRGFCTKGASLPKVLPMSM